MKTNQLILQIALIANKPLTIFILKMLERGK